MQNGQLIQKNDNKQKGYEDPILQAQFQVRHLKEFLKKNHFPEVPIEYLVMMSHPNAILKTAQNSEARFRVCRGKQVVYRIEEISKRYQKEILD